MKAHPSFPLFPSDLLVGTALMNNEELGIYVRLLCFQWAHHALPNDPKALAKLVQGQSIPPIVMAKFKLEGDCLKNQRMEIERAKLLAVNCLVPEGKSLTSPTIIPAPLNRDGFPEAWSDYEQHRIERNEPLTPMTRRQLMLKCERMGPRDATKAIRQAITASWKNIHEPHELNTYGKQATAPTKPAKPTPMQEQVRHAQDVLANLERKAIEEVDKAINFLRTLSDTAIHGYFSTEEKVVITKILS